MVYIPNNNKILDKISILYYYLLDIKNDNIIINNRLNILKKYQEIKELKEDNNKTDIENEIKELRE